MLEAIQEFFDAGGTEAKSGRFAVLVPADTVGGSKSRWNGASKFSRRWMLKTLQEKAQANLVFVEIKVDSSSNDLQEYTERLMSVRDVTREELDSLAKTYEEEYAGIQEDGTEDDLAYMQLINYNQKVVINNMMSGYLGSRMAHFLAAVHPYRHTIYLTTNGESEYNVAGKIGGDSSLTALGDQYARRVAEFADLVVGGGATEFECVDISAEQVNDLQRMLTAAGEAEADSDGIFAADVGWEELDTGVKAGMRLARVLPQGALDFVEVPTTVEEVLELVGHGPTVLIFVDAEADLSQDVPARLVTSSLRRTKETAAHIRTFDLQLENGKVWHQFLNAPKRNLDDVYAGEYEGLTTGDIQIREPEEVVLRKMDKLGYRYPRGESYYDIIARLDAVVKTFETAREPILIVSHLAVLRMIYAYIKGIPREDATEIDIPMHTIIKLDWDGTGHFNEESQYKLGPEGPKRARWS